MSSVEQNQGKFQAQMSLLSKMRGKLKLWGSRSSNSINKEDEQSLPMIMAIGETHSLGSLLDRIASLEDRIAQLCLELDSCKRSLHSSSTDKSSGASSGSGNGSKLERTCSYPTFGIQNPQCQRLPHINNLEFQENTKMQQEQLIKISRRTKKKKQQNSGKKREKKSSKNGNKNVRPSWANLKMLGC